MSAMSHAAFKVTPQHIFGFDSLHELTQPDPGGLSSGMSPKSPEIAGRAASKAGFDMLEVYGENIE